MFRYLYLTALICIIVLLTIKNVSGHLIIHITTVKTKIKNRKFQACWVFRNKLCSSKQTSQKRELNSSTKSMKKSILALKSNASRTYRTRASKSGLDSPLAAAVNPIPPASLPPYPPSTWRQQPQWISLKGFHLSRAQSTLEDAAKRQTLARQQWLSETAKRFHSKGDAAWFGNSLACNFLFLFYSFCC